jgi:hypothetical protein
MADANPPRFTVATPQPLLDRIRAWAADATARGVRSEFLAALKEMNERLEADPVAWGDLLREYVQIDAVEMRGMVPRWLLVWYGVHDRARQVIVRDILPAPGSPLIVPLG